MALFSRERLSSMLGNNQKICDDNFVLVYQMGKVGSSSIEKSLDEVGIPSMHLHTFRDHEEFLIYNNRKDVKCFFNSNERLAYRLVMQKRLFDLKRKEKLKIITLVRDPVATIVSRFFQDLHLQFIEAKKNLTIHQDIDSTLEYLMSAFDENINVEYFYNWFDAELKSNFAVNIHQETLNANQQYFRFSNSGVDTLLLKCEYLNQNEAVVADFLGRDGFSLITANESGSKWYGELYAKFKASYPFEKLFYLYDTPLYASLYSTEEIVGFKKRWSSPS